MKFKVSIIIPAYNAGKTLDSCVSSLLVQEYPVFEIIIINDGSTDNTQNICDALALTPKIIVHTQNNMGVSVARNRGLDLVRGDYVIFIDSDDVVDPDYVKTLMLGCECDFVTAGFYMQTAQKDWLIQKFTDECITTKHLQSYPSRYMGKYYFGGPVGKLFKRSIIEDNHLRFNPEIHSGEDTLFIFEYLSHTQSVRILPLSGYRYYYYGSSLAHKFHHDYWKWKLIVEKKILEFFTPISEYEFAYLDDRFYGILQDLAWRYHDILCPKDFHRLIYKDPFFDSPIKRKLNDGTFADKLFLYSMEHKNYSLYGRYTEMVRFVRRCRGYIKRHFHF